MLLQLFDSVVDFASSAATLLHMALLPAGRFLAPPAADAAGRFFPFPKAIA
jgi:hypothetical protein